MEGEGGYGSARRDDKLAVCTVGSRASVEVDDQSLFRVVLFEPSSESGRAVPHSMMRSIPLSRSILIAGAV